MEALTRNGLPLPLSSLRLLVPPLRLVSAALWQVVQQRDVMDYGLVEEFVTTVLEIVPDMMSYRERVQLIMGLRAQLVLELCRSDHLANPETIQPHLNRMNTCIITHSDKEISDPEVEASESNFLKLIQTLLEDPVEKELFFQSVFPEEFGPKYDSALQTLVWEFLSRLEKLLPAPTLQQTASWFLPDPSVLEECVQCVSHPQPLKTLLQHHNNTCGHGDTNARHLPKVVEWQSLPRNTFSAQYHKVVNRISACLADISVWMTDHHFKLNLGKTELLFLPGKDCPFHDLAITVDNSIVSSSQSAKNLGVILDNTLSFSTNIKAVTRSCRFMLYNIRRVRPCLTQEAAQVLIQALVISRLDYCNSLLAGLPACAIKPLQLIQNAAARLVFNFPKFSHVTPLLRSLHWLPVEARIRYKTMVLAYGAVRGTAPPYLQALIRPYTQTRALRSSTSGLLASLPLRKYSSRSAQSKLFAALAPQWWNKLPHDARSAESITTFRRHLKPHLFKEYLG
ncbi:uncharacterized protein ACWYII_019092 isoform 2-T4 [Salvelinus alpinus]